MKYNGHTPKEFTENVMKLTGDSTTEQTMKRVIIEWWESLKENEDFPTGYYERFLDQNNLKDTPEAKNFFASFCDFAWYHGEEYLEEFGNAIAKIELESPSPRIELRK